MVGAGSRMSIMSQGMQLVDGSVVVTHSGSGKELIGYDASMRAIAMAHDHLPFLGPSAGQLK
jgi:hypothetical protein